MCRKRTMFRPPIDRIHIEPVRSTPLPLSRPRLRGASNGARVQEHDRTTMDETSAKSADSLPNASRRAPQAGTAKREGVPLARAIGMV